MMLAEEPRMDEISNVMMQPPSANNNTQNLVRIKVPKRACQGGFDEKFETDPYNIDLLGLMTVQEYTNAISVLNEKMKAARSKSVDTALLATGVLMVPLALWGVRHGLQQKKRKKLLLDGIENFNFQHPYLFMRWNRRPVSLLTIERRREDMHGPPPGGALLPPSNTTQDYFTYTDPHVT